jgi:hypothetical protein
VAIASIHEARFVLFDDDTRLLFATSFDGSWDAYMDDFFTSGPTLRLFDAIFQHVEGYGGLPDVAAVKAFVLGAQVSAAAYARNYPGTVKEIRKAVRVNRAFQQVLDDPEAATALQQPASAGPVGGHDGGQSGMVVVGVSDMGAKIEREMCRAEKIETRQPKADVEDIERAAVSVGAATA